MATPDSVRAAITALHQAIADHTDPDSKMQLTQALQVAMKVQQRDYQQASQTHTAAQTVAGALQHQQGPSAQMQMQQPQAQQMGSY